VTGYWHITLISGTRPISINSFESFSMSINLHRLADTHWDVSARDSRLLWSALYRLLPKHSTGESRLSTAY
jgi:hypothetical protein